MRITILAHSQQMLNAAESKQWDRLASLDAQFRIMLERYLADASLATSDVDSLLSLLLEQNEQIMSAVRQAQTELLKLQDREVRGLKAMKSYLQPI